MYQGKKFNSRMEPMGGPDGHYLSIERYRFYQRCCSCSAEFTFLTDPQHMRYAIEAGAMALSVPHEHDAAVVAAARAQRAALERDDPMAALAVRADEAKHAAAEMDRLDDLRTLNARRECVDVETLLRAAHGDAAAGNTDDDEASLAAFRETTSRVVETSAAVRTSVAPHKREPAAKRARSSWLVHVKAAKPTEAAPAPSARLCGLPGLEVYGDD